MAAGIIIVMVVVVSSILAIYYPESLDSSVFNRRKKK